MKAYKNLVRYCLDKEYAISVWDGEEWQVRHSTSYDEIIEAIESVEEAQIRIRSIGGNLLIAWAFIIPFGLRDDETVADYLDCEFMQKWNDQYALLDKS